MEYRSEDGEQTVEGLAARFGVDVFDLLFLNQSRFPKLQPSSVLKKETKLRIPQPATLAEIRAEVGARHSSWFVVPEDMAFKKCAEIIGVEPRELIAINKDRPELKGLGMSSELLAGTRLQVKPIEYDFDEYCHWSFPDDNPALAEPSYMMARRLMPKAERRPRGEGAASARAEALLRGERPPVKPSGKRASFIQAIEDKKAEEARRKQEWADSAWHIVAEDIPFKKEAEKLGIEARELRDINCQRLKGLQLSSFLKKDTWLQIKPLDDVAPLEEPKKVELHLVNRVVQIDGEDDYEFWYVLTYLPDLQWCHVAPLERRGVFDGTPTRRVTSRRARTVDARLGGGGRRDRRRRGAVPRDGGAGDEGHARERRHGGVGHRGPCAAGLDGAAVGQPPAQGQEAEADPPPPPVDAGSEGRGEAPGQRPGAAAPAEVDPAAQAALAAKLEAKERADAERAAKSEAKARADAEKSEAKARADAEKNEAAALHGLKNVLRMIARQKHAEAFLDPVDWEGLDLPDYPTIVTRPMDLGTVQRRLDEGGYSLVLDVVADVDLVWTNAMLYNPEDNWVHQAAKAAKEFADRKLESHASAARARAPLLAKAPTATALEE